MATAGSTGTINLTKKASPKVLERFKFGSCTEGLFSHDYDWTGVATVQIYTVDNLPLNDYNPEKVDGSSRFGNLINVGDTIQEHTVKDNKSFIGVIEESYNTQQMQIKRAGQILRRQTDEVMIPYVDKYRLRKLASGAKFTASETLTKGNIVEKIMMANAAMSEMLVGDTGRVLYMSYGTAIKLKLAEQVVGVPSVTTYGGGGSGVGKGSLGEKAIVNGVIGKIDKTQIRLVPAGYLPNNVEFMIVKSGVAFAPTQIKSYKVHDGAHVLDGKIVTGHLLHDCFVPVGRDQCIFVVTASGSSSISTVGSGVLSLADGTLDVSGSGTAYTATLSKAGGAKTVAVSTTNGSGIVTGDVMSVVSADPEKVEVLGYDPTTGLATLKGNATSGTCVVTFTAAGKPGFDSPASVALTITGDT